MKKKPLFKIFVAVFFSIFAVYCVSRWHIHEPTLFFSSISIQLIPLFAVLFIFIINFFLITLRSKLSYAQFGYDISYKLSLKTTLSGQFSSIFLSLFGSILGQSTALRSTIIPAQTISMVCLYERLVLAVTGAVMSFVVVCDLFKEKLSQIVHLSWHFFEIGVVILGALALIKWMGIKKSEKNFLASFFSFRNWSYIAVIATMTCLSWCLMALGFVFAVISVFPNVPLVTLFKASILVSFIASLPLSVSGWGIREFAAIQIFGYLAIDPKYSLVSSICVGVLSLCSLAIVTAVMKPLMMDNVMRRTSKKSDIPKETASNNIKKSGISASLLQNFKNANSFELYAFLGYCASVLIFFQIDLSLSSYALKINCADIFALCGLALFCAQMFIQKDKIFFKINHLSAFIPLMGCVLGASFVVGILHFGFTPWALGKVMGFFVLLGYASIGLMCIQNNGTKSFHRIVDMMVATLLAIVLWRISGWYIASFGFFESYHPQPSLEGFSGNRNAFALQLLVVISLVHIRYMYQKSSSFSFFRMKWHYDEWVLGVLYASLIFTYSRSGILVGAFLLGVFWVLNVINFQKLLRISGFIGFMWCIVQLPVAFFSVWGQKFVFLFNSQLFSGDYSDHERWYSILQGLKMWWEHPLLGAGLGAFMHEELIKNARPLVIHNTFVWFLAEFGILGSASFLAFGGSHALYLARKIFKAKNKMIKKLLSSSDMVLLSLLLVFGSLSLAHEVFYQRIFWLVWGMSIAKISRKKQILVNDSVFKKAA